MVFRELILETWVSRSSWMPTVKGSLASSRLMFSKGRMAIEGSAWAGADSGETCSG